MKNSNFYNIFVEFISDIYDAENQIVDSLPLMIKNSSHDELKKGLSKHLEETKYQVKRLEKIFTFLKKSPERKFCKGMEGLIEEGKEILQKPGLSPNLKDCFIIIGAQKIEHYEIACYGSAIALVEHIESVYSENDEFKKIRELLEESLKEERNADVALTKVAEGKLFVEGVNDELEKEINVKA